MCLESDCLLDAMASVVCVCVCMFGCVHDSVYVIGVLNDAD